MARRAKRYREGEETFLLAKAGDKSQRVCASDRSKYAFMREEACVQYYDVGAIDPIKSSRTVSDFLYKHVTPGDRQQEMMWVICLDTRNKPIALSEPFRGGRNEAAVDMSVLLQGVVLSGAVSFIVAHNHPSGEPAPSDADLALTKRIAKAGDILGLKLLDHVILVNDPKSYFSFLDAGMMPTTQDLLTR